MAITKPTTSITWPTGQSSVTVAAGATATSEAFAINATATEISFAVDGDNTGTPASDDIIEVYLLPTLGTPDKTATDDHGELLGSIDTFLDDPGTAVFLGVSATMKEGQLHLKSRASSNSITVSAIFTELRVA